MNNGQNPVEFAKVNGSPERQELCIAVVWAYILGYKILEDKEEEKRKKKDGVEFVISCLGIRVSHVLSSSGMRVIV